MAVSIANLTSGSDSDGNSTATTASISPAANNLILLSVTLRNGSSINPSVSSVSGNGLTWVKIDSTVFDNSSSSRRTVELWRSMGASPSTGAITITATENETNIDWSVDQSSGVDTSGTNGSGAIVQSAKNQDVAGTATGLVVTLAAFGSSDNATFGVFGTDEVATLTIGSGFNQLAKINGASTPVSILTEWKSTNDTSVDATTGAAVFIGGIAIEIKAAATTAIKTINGLSKASVKTVNGLAIASVKTWNGLA
jgi:hypothetical protein